MRLRQSVYFLGNDIVYPIAEAGACRTLHEGLQNLRSQYIKVAISFEGIYEVLGSVDEVGGRFDISGRTGGRLSVSRRGGIHGREASSATDGLNDRWVLYIFNVTVVGACLILSAFEICHRSAVFSCFGD